MEKENNRNVVGVKEGRLSSKPIKMRDILPFSRSTLCSWSRSWHELVHVMAKQRKACLTPFQTVAMPSKILSAVLLRASFHLHGYLGWPGLERQPGFDLYYSKLQIVWCYSQWQPRFHAAVIYAFITVTPSEERYSNIERELIGIAVRHGEASQLCVWRTSHRSKRTLTSGDELEEEFCHCQSEMSMPSSEACQIRTSSGEQL